MDLNQTHPWRYNDISISIVHNCYPPGVLGLLFYCLGASLILLLIFDMTLNKKTSIFSLRSFLLTSLILCLPLAPTLYFSVEAYCKFPSILRGAYDKIFVFIFMFPIIPIGIYFIIRHWKMRPENITPIKKHHRILLFSIALLAIGTPPAIIFYQKNFPDENSPAQVKRIYP